MNALIEWLLLAAVLTWVADTDECNSSVECGNHSECINGRGSYACRCLPGYKFEVDNGTCVGTLYPICWFVTSRLLIAIGRNQWQIQKFWLAGGKTMYQTRVIYRTCIQRIICLLNGKRRVFGQKKFLAIRGDFPHRPPYESATGRNKPTSFHDRVPNYVYRLLCWLCLVVCFCGVSVSCIEFCRFNIRRHQSSDWLPRSPPIRNDPKCVEWGRS